MPRVLRPGPCRPAQHRGTELGAGVCRPRGLPAREELVCKPPAWSGMRQGPQACLSASVSFSGHVRDNDGPAHTRESWEAWCSGPGMCLQTHLWSPGPGRQGGEVRPFLGEGLWPASPWQPTPGTVSVPHCLPGDICGPTRARGGLGCASWKVSERRCHPEGQESRKPRASQTAWDRGNLRLSCPA